MKHRRLFGIALLFPYLFWVISILIANLFSPRDVPDIWNFLLVPILYYAAGVFLWFIPYTLLAIGMWIWSKNKSIVYLRQLGLLAPILFSALITIEYSILTLINSLPSEGETILVSEVGNAILSFLALLITSSLLIGYLLVGIALAVYKILQSKNLIEEEVQSST